jgi:hypothetical protein
MYREPYMSLYIWAMILLTITCHAARSLLGPRINLDGLILPAVLAAPAEGGHSAASGEPDDGGGAEDAAARL